MIRRIGFTLEISHIPHLRERTARLQQVRTPVQTVVSSRRSWYREYYTIHAAKRQYVLHCPAENELSLRQYYLNFVFCIFEVRTELLLLLCCMYCWTYRWILGWCSAQKARSPLLLLLLLLCLSTSTCVLFCFPSEEARFLRGGFLERYDRRSNSCIL